MEQIFGKPKLSGLDSPSETNAFLATCVELHFQKDRTNGSSPIHMFRPPESTCVLTGSASDSQRTGTASVLNHPLCVILHSGRGAGHRLSEDWIFTFAAPFSRTSSELRHWKPFVNKRVGFVRSTISTSPSCEADDLVSCWSEGLTIPLTRAPWIAAAGTMQTLMAHLHHLNVHHCGTV